LIQEILNCSRLATRGASHLEKSDSDQQRSEKEELFVETLIEMDAEPSDRPDCNCGGPKAWDWEL
jgi:hypothetical protein